MLIPNIKNVPYNNRFSLSKRNSFWDTIVINQIFAQRKLESYGYFTVSESSYLVSASIGLYNYQEKAKRRRTLKDPYKYTQYATLECYDSHHFDINLNWYEQDMDFLDDEIRSRQKIHFSLHKYIIPLKYSYKKMKLHYINRLL